MDLWLDCEFNGYKGELLSIALLNREHSFYATFEEQVTAPIDPWVQENVVPFLHTPLGTGIGSHISWIASGNFEEKQKAMEGFLQMLIQGREKKIHIISDWPDDVKYMSDLLLTGPGTMINIPGITFQVKRIDAYPTKIVDTRLKRHNAWWDAYALMVKDNDY